MLPTNEQMANLDRLDAILERGMENDKDIAYISIGGLLILIPPRDSDLPIVRYQLKEF